MNCPFCKAEGRESEVVRFHEHYCFCASCTAIWTYPIIVKGCKHIEENTRKASKVPTPYVVREPWYKGYDTSKVTFIFDGKCSKCGYGIETNGW